MENKKPTTVEEYIEQLPEPAQSIHKKVRSILKSVVPSATEGLKWGQPVFESETILFAYAAHKSHLTFVPTGPALKPFEKELEAYTTKKDSVQFPYNKPLPESLIQKIAEFRKEDVEERGAKWKY
ncbi:iron chaperone [Flagellimonas iocasae]|uniref:Iron chaperone n=1 Tax=Flagellimonas iocasae TaxID=2055905 RepID=A0ABW4XXE4_9FLAO